jgi:4-hydroxybenzoyl-CoA reductase subunit beta
MNLPEFELVRPETLEEALRFLADHGRDTMVIAGGTDAIPNLRMKLFSPRFVLDIKGLPGLSGISSSASPDLMGASDGLRIGALTTITEVAEAKAVRAAYPVLSEAAATIASPLLRNMGTIGGNLCLETRCRWYNQSFFWRHACGFCLKKDGSICHVAPGGQRCWAVWSGDTAPALLTLDGEAEIASVGGRRRVRLDEFYRNDGMDRIHLKQEELLTAVYLPARMAGYRGCYKKFRIRNSIDYPLVGVAAAMKTDRGGTCRDARVALTAVNPAPLLIREVGSLLAGKRISHELLEEASRMAARTGKPLTTSASTPEYRREILKVYTRRALEAVWRDGPRA